MGDEMKKYLAAILCLALTAHAELPTIELSLNEHTNIFITPVTCEPEPGYIMFLKDKGGKILGTGCWARLGEDHITIRYSDGTRYIYKIEDLKKP